MSDVSDIFIRYYREKFWGNQDGSSGPNSAYELTPILRSGLQRLLRELKVSSICDAGCGDANLIKYLDLGTTQYLGIDCVPKTIDDNRKVFKDNTKMRFEVVDITSDPLPDADLILCRDVVHYLPNPLVQKFLDKVLASKAHYLLITHNLYSPLSANTPTEIGIFRPVNLCQPPFNWPKPDRVIDEDVYGKALALWDLKKVMAEREGFEPPDL